MANEMNIPTIADSQAGGQWQTSNDADAALANALADILTVDFSGGDVALTSAQFRSAMTFVPSGLSATRALTVPAVKRALFFVHNTDGADTITVTRGSTTVSVLAGKLGAFYTDGTTNGLIGAIFTTGLAGTGDVVGPSSVTDGNPAVFDGATGKIIKERTFTQFTASLIAMVGDSGSGGIKGLVPAPAIGDAAAVKFLKADGTWAVPAGTGAFTAASTTDVLTGTDTAKGVTPDALAALWEKGADTASAGTVALGEGGFFHVTGTTAITDIDWSTAKDGRHAWVIFDGILTLTHNATTLKLPGNANITTAAGDRAIFVQDNSDNVICLAYIRADGTPLLSSLLRSDATANLTKGFTASGYSAGTKSSGTFTPDPANGNLQYATNGGAHTLAPPSTGTGDAVSMAIQYTNNGSAGTITTSGFTKVTGDSLTTTNTSKFMFYITVINSISHLNIVAMQ
jgi:hypothetical protein